MSKLSPTNLTDRLSYLREHKKDSEVTGGQRPKKHKEPLTNRFVSERKFATDYFMLFVYSLFVISMLSQVFLIAWLEIF